jgi:hypothetical protein
MATGAHKEYRYAVLILFVNVREGKHKIEGRHLPMCTKTNRTH